MIIRSAGTSCFFILWNTVLVFSKHRSSLSSLFVRRVEIRKCIDPCLDFNARPLTFLALSFNQPSHDVSDGWTTDGTTVFNATVLGVQPLGLFIDQNNSIYVNDGVKNRTMI